MSACPFCEAFPLERVGKNFVALEKGRYYLTMDGSLVGPVQPEPKFGLLEYGWMWRGRIRFANKDTINTARSLDLVRNANGVSSIEWLEFWKPSGEPAVKSDKLVRARTPLWLIPDIYGFVPVDYRKPKAGEDYLAAYSSVSVCGYAYHGPTLYVPATELKLTHRALSSQHAPTAGGTPATSDELFGGRRVILVPAKDAAQDEEQDRWGLI